MGVGSDAESVVAEYHNSLEKVAEEQDKVLEQMLRRESECEYLRRHGFNGETDVESFKRLLPVIEYDAIEQDLKRIMEGDTSPILTSEQVIKFCASSGTSNGKRKAVPVTAVKDEGVHKFITLRHAFMSLSPIATAYRGLTMDFASVGKTSVLPGGLSISQISTFFYKSPAYTTLSGSVTGPIEVVLCEDYRQSTYCHVICGLLRSSEVTNFSGVLASAVASGFSLFKELWREMCTDIETGQLSNLVTDPAARAAVTKLLARPNKELADLVRAECSRDSWEGILHRLWPNAKFIECVATGSMLQYVDHLNFLTSAQLPIVSTVYAGSEGVYGFNPCLLNPPHDTFYVMLHNASTYFEFIKVNGEQPADVKQQAEALSTQDNGEEARIVGLSGVQEGQNYELVISNGVGLWRYKVGDVVQCVGFYHQAPKFKFVGRKNVTISIHTDKTEEKELSDVVNKAAKQHLPANARLYDFTSCASLDSVPGHYVLFWEITTVTGAGYISLGDKALAEACFTMEAALSEPYRRGRIIGAIAPLELRIVQPGTFVRIKQDALYRGTSPPQYKTPRVYKAGSPALDLLNARAIETCRSPRSPPHPTLNPVGSVYGHLT